MLKTKIVGNTVVTLDYAIAPDDGGKYMLVCENHSYLIQGKNKQTLWQHAEGVMEWCDACAGNDDRFPNDKWEAK